MQVHTSFHIGLLLNLCIWYTTYLFSTSCNLFCDANDVTLLNVFYNNYNLKCSQPFYCYSCPKSCVYGNCFTDKLNIVVIMYNVQYWWHEFIHYLDQCSGAGAGLEPAYFTPLEPEPEQRFWSGSDRLRHFWYFCD